MVKGGLQFDSLAGAGFGGGGGGRGLAVFTIAIGELADGGGGGSGGTTSMVLDVGAAVPKSRTGVMVTGVGVSARTTVLVLAGGARQVPRAATTADTDASANMSAPRTSTVAVRRLRRRSPAGVSRMVKRNPSVPSPLASTAVMAR